MAAKLRPKTDIPGNYIILILESKGHLLRCSFFKFPGLYLSGQDVFSCGFTGALFGGLLAAGTVLERNVMNDLIGLHKFLVREEKKNKNV